MALSRPQNQTILLGGGLLASCVGLLCFPREISACVRQALELFASTLFPALFPFFILTTLFVELGFSQILGTLLRPIMERLFHLRGVCAGALALGLIGGYPAGANAAVTLYRQKQCSKEEAQALLAFCNNGGPSFVLGVVGSTVFQDFRCGVLLYLVHLTAALLTGIFCCHRNAATPARKQPSSPVICSSTPFPVAFIHAVTGAFQSLLHICAFLVCFRVITELLILTKLPAFLTQTLSGLFPLPPTLWDGLLFGFLELTSGVVALTDGTLTQRLLLAALLLGWGGWSIHFQTLTLLADTDLSPLPYLSGKALHAGLSAALMGVLLVPGLRLPLLSVLCAARILPIRRKNTPKKEVENRPKVYYNRGS